MEMHEKSPPSPPLNGAFTTDTSDEGITGFVYEIEDSGDIDKFVGVARSIANSVVGVRVGVVHCVRVSLIGTIVAPFWAY